MRRRGGGLRRFAADRSGATALELAIVSPVLVIFLFGIFSAGMGFYYGSAVRSAVQRASRTLIASPDTSAATIKANAQAMLSNVPVQNFTLAISRETVGAATIQRVSWSYSYLVSVPFLPGNNLSFDSSLVVPLTPG